MHDLEKRFPNLPEILMVVVKVPSHDPRLGKTLYQNMRVPKDKCLKFIDALDGKKAVQILTSVKKEKPASKKKAETK